MILAYLDKNQKRASICRPLNNLIKAEMFKYCIISSLRPSILCTIYLR